MNFLLPWQWMITITAEQLFLIFILNQKQIWGCHSIRVGMAWEFVTPTTRDKKILLRICTYVLALLAFYNYVLRGLRYGWLQFNPYFTFILFHAKPHLNSFLSQASKKLFQATEKRRQELSGISWDVTDSVLCDDGAFYSYKIMC